MKKSLALSLLPVSNEANSGDLIRLW